MTDTRPKDQELLTINEVCELLNVTRATVKYWLYQKRSLPFYKVGERVRIKRADVEAFIVRG